MELEGLGKTPISEESPAGQEISYEPEFEALQSEIDKMSVVSAAGEVDWKKVVELSSTLLAQKGKHILVCVYLTRGLMEIQGFKGLCLGTQILKDLIENFWDTLYPPKKRKRGRINALKWWADKTESFLRSLTDGPDLDKEEISKLKANIKELDSILEEKLGEDAPILRSILQAIDRLPIKEEVKEQAPSEEVVQKEINQTQDANFSSGSVSHLEGISVGELESEKDVNRFLAQCTSALGQVVHFYLNQDLAKPLLYQVNRFCAWVDIDALPMVQDGNKTMIPPPDETIRSSIQGLIASKEYEDAIRACESRVREFVFWLDLSYWTAQCLQELGGKYSKAYDAVSYTTFAYAQRLSGIEALTFSDGTPFLSPEAKAWLREVGNENSDISGTTQARDSFFTELEQKAKEFLSKKQVIKAIGVWQEGIEKGKGIRQKFLCRMALTRLLFSVGKKNLAIPQVLLLLKDVKNYALEDWEPDIVTQAFSLMLEVLDGVKGQEEIRQEIKDRLVCLNPILAFKTLK
ncbi:type VI secretion system protein VasJ [Desulfonauticus submarinus]|uniref:Type VI secretion system protein VasJ n=1 Tax=Desulfonauticus submarinus TaxID=206665 RepID=A0A1G9ZTV2_9BACT|nr:type VI secretion system protein TssA [Desulfonauticus submarinus]SDN24640.1 type VI secretion system protein VasJ [Desulfonauticus submarinus]